MKALSRRRIHPIVLLQFFYCMKIRSIVFLSIWVAAECFPSMLAAQPLPPTIISACDFCMCSQGISPLEMGGSAIRYDVRYTELSHEYLNGERVPNATQTAETYLTNQMSLTYGIAPGLWASLIVPYAHKTESAVYPTSTLISNNGIGDVSLFARYNLIADHKFGDTRIFSVTGGIKFANGNTSLMDDGARRGEQFADPDVQLGTGTTDFIAGLGYLIGFDDWSIGANALAGIRGFGLGANGHVYGNNLNYDVTARYRIYETIGENSAINPTIFGALGIRGEWRGYELQDGQRIDDSGGDVMYVAPGMQIFFTPTISLDATVWLPFIHALNGDQVAETVKVLAGAQVVF
jgi:hypothetical protein